MLLDTLKNKKVLVTAGPTWVPIDKVRVISNIATGETGILLADKLQRLGAKVTLLLGPVSDCCLWYRKVYNHKKSHRSYREAIFLWCREVYNHKKSHRSYREAIFLNKRIKLLHFKFFDELKNKITKELKNKRYDIVVHCAAVSDYQPQTTYRQKVKSGKKIWKLNLVPTTKIIDLIKKIDSHLFLVGFKFEAGVKGNVLIEKTKGLIKRARLDLAVGNSIKRGRYCAYIINHNRNYGPLVSKTSLVEKLIKLMGDYLCKN